jgi:hypothetical protein
LNLDVNGFVFTPTAAIFRGWFILEMAVAMSPANAPI